MRHHVYAAWTSLGNAGLPCSGAARFIHAFHAADAPNFSAAGRSRQRNLKKTMPSDDGFVFSLEKRITNVVISAFNHDKKPAFVDRQRGGK